MTKLSLPAILAALALAQASPAMAQYSYTTTDIPGEVDRSRFIPCNPTAMTATVTKPGSASAPGNGTVSITMMNYYRQPMDLTVVFRLAFTGANTPVPAVSFTPDVSVTIPASSSMVVSGPVWFWPPATAVGFVVRNCRVG